MHHDAKSLDHAGGVCFDSSCDLVIKSTRSLIPPGWVCEILTLTVLKLAASSSLLTTAESKLR